LPTVDLAPEHEEEWAMEDPAQVADRWLEAFNAHDRDRMTALTAPDCRMTVPPEMTLEGEPAVTGYSMAWLEAFPDARIDVVATHVAGATVVQEFRFEGTHDATLHGPGGDIPATHRHLSGRGVQVLEIRDGRVTESRLYFDQVQVLTQLGVMPTPAHA